MSVEQARTAIETYLFDNMNMSKAWISYHRALINEICVYVARGIFTVHNAALYVIEVAD